MKKTTLLRAGAIALALGSVGGTAQAETLRQALTSAYLNNPSIQSALLNVKATAENIVSAKSAKLPTVGLTASSNDSFTVGSSLGAPAISVGANYSQRLFDNYKSDADIEAARALTEASRYALQNSEQNILLAVVEAYWDVIRDQQLVQLRSENVRFYTAQVQSATERLNIGEGTKIDVSQAQARLAQGQASYQAAVASLQTSQASYEQYVGHRPSNLVSTYKVGSLLPSTLDRVIAMATVSHPAVLSAKAAIRASQANSDSASAAYGPTFDVIGSINQTLFSAGTVGPSPAAGSVRFSLAVPIYGGGAYGASIRKANLNQMKSEVDALAARDQIKASAISAWATMQSASAQIQSANTAVSSGQLSLQGIVQERDVGQATTLDVLNAQSELESVQEGLIQATAGKAIATFAVIASTGHLTAADLGLNVQIKTGEDYIEKVEDVWQELRAVD